MQRTVYSGPKVSVSGQLRCGVLILTIPSKCYDHADSVKIVVQDSNTLQDPTSISKTFQIPRGLLRWHSAYFAAALDPESDFCVGKDEALTLTENIEVFETFLCWLYTGKLKDPPSSPDDAARATCYLKPRLLCEIWVFADMRGIPALGNAAIDMSHELISAYWVVPTYIVAHFIYENTRSGAQLRALLVGTCVLISTLDQLEKLDADKVPSRFLLDIFPSFIRRAENAKPVGRLAYTVLDRCSWHDHSGPGGKLRLESRK